MLWPLTAFSSTLYTLLCVTHKLKEALYTRDLTATTLAQNIKGAAATKEHISNKDKTEYQYQESKTTDP